jgi:hypothetical protein
VILNFAALQIRNGEESRIAENRRRKLERRALLTQVRGRHEPPGEGGNREKMGKGAERKSGKMSLSAARQKATPPGGTTYPGIPAPPTRKLRGNVAASLAHCRDASAAKGRRPQHDTTREAVCSARHGASAGQQVGFEEGIEISIEHAVGIAHFKFCAMVLNEPIGMQNVGPDLAAKIDIGLCRLELVRRFLP